MPEHRREVKGTVVRGEDGSLYFIPADQMRAFKLPDEDTAEVRELLDKKNIKALGGLLPAFHARAFENGGPGVDATDVEKLRPFSPNKSPRS